MSLTSLALTTLLSGGEMPGSAATVPRPARRWKSRVLLPAVILGTTAAIFAYSAKSALLPETQVWAAPVVAVPRAATSELPSDTAGITEDVQSRAPGEVLVQAPGWIEPAPFPISVPVLTEGVIKEVLVLEGDRVEKGQVLARLVDEEARLGVKSAEAQLAALKAAAAQARANLHAAESRVAEIEDQLGRARHLASSGAYPEKQEAQLTIRLQAAQQEVEAEQAAVDVALANIRKQEVTCEEAQLTLKRMEIVSPESGVVMSRLVEPGTRISMSGRAGGEPMSGALLRLYDPARLQVRVDIPLADFAKLRIGSDAEVVTEALPDVVFRGVLKRVVHEANIQRNTIPVKVTIENPSEVLKPEMLARVRFYGAQGKSSSPSEPGIARGEIARADLRLLIPADALVSPRNGQASVWLVKHDARAGGMIAVFKEIRTDATNVPGYIEVLEGLQAGDRVIIEAPADLENARRVRIVGEKPTQASTSETRS